MGIYLNKMSSPLYSDVKGVYLYNIKSTIISNNIVINKSFLLIGKSPF